MKIIRWSFLVPTIVIIALLTLFNILFFDVVLKKSVISAGEMIFGAKVEIDSLTTSFTKVSLSIDGLRCADRNDYFKNLIDIDHITFDAKFTPILRKKFIIDEMTVSGLKWGTSRKISGKLSPKKEKKFNKKQKKDSMFAKLFESAKNKANEEFNKLPAVDAFSDVESQIKDFDAAKLIDKSNLQSVKEINKLSEDIQNKYKNYQTDFDNLKIEEKIQKTKNLIDQVSKTKVSSFDDITKAAKNIEELKNNKKEFDKILKELNNAKKDIANSVDISKQIQNAVNKDVDSVSSKLSVSKLNSKNISSMIAGRQWINRVETVIYYMSLIKKYMPEKDKEPVKERSKGRDVIFAQKAYPSLLISKINISGTAASEDKQGKAIAFSGSINNISSSPDMVSEPVTLNIVGNNGKQNLMIEGLFDHRGKTSEDLLKISMSGVSGESLNIPENDYMPLVNTADIKISSRFELVNDNFSCGADVSVKDIKEKNLKSVKGNIKYLAEITNTIKSFTLNAKAKSKEDGSLDFEIKSDIDKKISDAISQLFSSKISEAKAKVKEEINAILKEQTKQVEDNIKVQQDSLLKNINSQTDLINNIKKSIKY
ncbi:MAG: TIGR03545 family protein [Endomicrobiaceae bacterium]